MSIFAEDTVYVTVQEARDESENLSSCLKNEGSDDKVKAYINRAEDQIDCLIREYPTKVDEDQEHIFPTQEMGIPNKIKRATILLAECYCRKDDSSGATVPTDARVVKSEKRRGNQIVYEDAVQESDNYKPKYDVFCMSPEIEQLLKPYIKDQTGNCWFRT